MEEVLRGTCATLQVWNPDFPENEVLVMVCRTGMNTTMGTMIRELVAPSKVYEEKDPFMSVCLQAFFHITHRVQ